jgi:hypothetical protein
MKLEIFCVACWQLSMNMSQFFQLRIESYFGFSSTLPWWHNSIKSLSSAAIACFLSGCFNSKTPVNEYLGQWHGVIFFAPDATLYIQVGSCGVNQGYIPLPDVASSPPQLTSDSVIVCNGFPPEVSSSCFKKRLPLVDPTYLRTACCLHAATAQLSSPCPTLHLVYFFKNNNWTIDAVPSIDGEQTLSACPVQRVSQCRCLNRCLCSHNGWQWMDDVPWNTTMKLSWSADHPRAARLRMLR